MSEPDLSYIHESLQHLAVPIVELRPDPKNARVHDRRNLDAIKASLQKFGFRQPIIVQQQDMIVRAGNGRLTASKELGWSHVPAVIVDEAEAEAVAFAIADNRTAELAEWDWEHLAEALDDDGVAWSDLKLFEDDELELFTQASWSPAAVTPDPPVDAVGEGKARADDVITIHIRGRAAEKLRELTAGRGSTPEDVVLDLVGLR